MTPRRNSESGGEGKLHQLSRAMGAVEEGLKNLKGTVDDERAEARSHRESLRSVIAALTEAVRVLTSQVTEMVPDVRDYRERRGELAMQIAEMAPDWRDYRETRAELRGAAKLGKAVWLGGMALSGIVGAITAWGMQHFAH